MERRPGVGILTEVLITNEWIPTRECNFIIKLLTDDGMMCYLLQGAKEVEPRGRMTLIQDIFYNPIYPTSQSVLPGGAIMPGMKIFGRTLMLIGGLQNYRQGTWYNLLPAVHSCRFPLELNTEVGLSSFAALGALCLL